MSGTKLFLDTNIALYLLSGDDTIATFLDGKEIYVSVISELELLGFQGIDSKELKEIEHFLSFCKIIDLSEPIKKETVALRQSLKIKLPDAIIAASAQHLNIPLFSADKAFSRISDIDLIIYDR